MIMYGLGDSSISHDFFAYDTTNKVWNGSAFVSKVAASYATYRIAATRISDVNTAGVPEGFSATAPVGTVRWELRERGASLELSPVVWSESDIQDEVKKIHRAASAVTPGGAVGRHLENSSGATLESIREVIDGDV